MSTTAPQEHETGQAVPKLPANVVLGAGTVVRGGRPFNRFRSQRERALRVGKNCLLENVHFALGSDAEMEIGDECYFTSPMLLCELRIVIGNRVMLGWNSTIMDSDFHPLDPALRLADAVACSPLSEGRARVLPEAKPVVIEDDVWIGPNVTILKGVRIGAGAYIEPGSMVGKDVAAGCRVIGNPARVVEELPA
jgi:acetyltransferase-like isoleucine patch superfamily enzyme